MPAFTATVTDRRILDAPIPVAGAVSALGGASRIITVQYLRALAASLVALHHALNSSSLAPYYVRPVGAFGVDLFFVISGYIMWATTAHTPRRGPRQFWTARILRVVPLYWLFTSLFIVIALVFPSALFTAALEPSHIVKSYLFIPAEHPPALAAFVQFIH
jgi:exopolysaccharide production protein ExoZ